MATEAARFQTQNPWEERKGKTNLTLTGLLMEGLGLVLDCVSSRKERKPCRQFSEGCSTWLTTSMVQSSLFHSHVLIHRW